MTTLGPVDIDEVVRLEEEADRTFGTGSREVRTILGLAIGYLHNLAGPEPTRAYVQKCLALIRKVDLLDTPPPDAPPAS